MTTPKYTFLLPAFKGKYLDDMLKSIKAQTYTDFKVLISDDCSPEDLRSICEPYLSDPRFSYRRNEENMGSKSLVSHWNLLVDMCDTEYLIMASDDDVYEPQFLAEIDALVQKYPNVDLYRARVKKIDGEGVTLATDFQTESFENQYEFLYTMFCQKRLMCIANYVFRRTALKKNKGFVEFPLAWNSDDATLLRISESGVGNTSGILFNFRSSGENISTTYSRAVSEKKAIADLEFALYYEDFVNNMRKPSNGRELRYLNDFISNMNLSLSNTLLDVSYLLDFSEMRKAYNFLKRTNRLRSKLQKIDYLWSWFRTRNK